jgi:hypothetical protein
MFFRPFSVLFLLSAGMSAQVICSGPGPMAGGASVIGGISNGAILTGSEPWYDPTTQTLQVPVGSVSDSTCRIEIQGMQPEKGQSVVAVPMGYSPQWWKPPNTIYQGKTFYEIPYVTALIDEHRMSKPLIYEVIDNTTETVLVRNKIEIIDKRRDGTFTQTHLPPLIYSAGAELTRTGADKLEVVHTSSMPQPDLATFNTELTSRFSSVVQSMTPPTDFGAPGKACVPLSSVDKAFLDTSAYKTAIAQSLLSYGIYEAAKKACKSPNPVTAAIGCAAETANCVRDKTPDASNFELCVSRIDGASKTLSLSGVKSTDLSITNAYPLVSQIELKRLDGTVDGSLSDPFIRWSDVHTGCTIRPSASLSAQDQLIQAVASWKTCAALEVDAAYASSGDISHTLTPRLELLDAGASAPLPLFTLDPSHPRNPDKGACTQFRNHVLALLDLYYPAMQSALDNTWLPQHKTAMDDLTSRWETGVNETMSDVDLVMTPLKPTPHYNDRFSMYFHTNAFSAPAPRQNAITWSLPGPFPCVDQPSGAPAMIPCNSGQTPWDTQFDASYTVTTNAMNQVLRARYFKLFVVPTFDDLGIQPPAGKVGTDPWEVDGAWLSPLFPAFSDLGSTKLTISLAATAQPFTYMPLDPAYYFNNGFKVLTLPDPTGRWPLTYQLAQYRVDFIGDHPGPDGTNTWLSFSVDLYDPNFNIDVNLTAGNNVLYPSYSILKSYIFLPTKSQFSGCPFAPLSKGSKCGNLLSGLVFDTMKPMLDSLFLNMLNGYPAPQLFDARGKATLKRNFAQTKRYYQQQVMTFYGDLN